LGAANIKQYLQSVVSRNIVNQSVQDISAPLKAENSITEKSLRLFKQNGGAETEHHRRRNIN
jgi:hypothetical protein